MQISCITNLYRGAQNIAHINEFHSHTDTQIQLSHKYQTGKPASDNESKWRPDYHVIHYVINTTRTRSKYDLGTQTAKLRLFHRYR